LAILSISVFPELELMESFTSPPHSTKTPRESCFSRNRTAPAGYVAGDLTALKSLSAAGLSWQKYPFSLSLHDWQLSFGSNP
jgi:hypothetical protein